MSDHFLSSFTKLPSTQYSNTLPSSQCLNGFPINKYASYGDNSLEVLYSIWNSYQSTIGAQFTQSQSNNFAPTSSQNTMIGPKNIFILRHGEKNISSINNVQYHLNQNGVYRACQIPTIINQFAVNGYPISYMISSNPCPMNSGSPTMRPQQTLQMASFLLNIPLFIFGQASNTDVVVDALFDTDPKNPFNGLNVLISWEHTAIQELCLKIINKCNTHGIDRSSINADTFFADPNVSVQTCPDGKYYAPPGYPPFTTDPQNPASIFYPFWNANNYDNIFCFFSNATNTNFEFILSNEQYFNCVTCYPSCELKIGLYQPANSNCNATKYYYSQDDNIESKCLPPTNWGPV
jgi:hypothetical protein